MMWNMGSKPVGNFETVCKHSRHVMTSRACSFDVYNHKNETSFSPSTEKDVKSIMSLLEQGKIWPTFCLGKRLFHENFWWDLVRPRKKIGTVKDQNKETVQESRHVQHLFDILCSTEEDRDYDDFQDDAICVDDVSIASSTMGSVASIAEDSPVDDDLVNDQDWEDLNEKERESNIGNSLKQLANIKKKTKMSPFILKDMLGDDATALVKNIGKTHVKSVQRDCLIINDIYRCVKYFNHMFEERRKALKINTDNSKNATYAKPVYWYRDEFRKLVKEKRDGMASSY